MMKTDSPFGALIWIVLGGLIVWGYGEATHKKDGKATASRETIEQRKQATQAVIKAGPQTTSWETPQGTVIALDIPKASFGGSLVEVKHCYVWRDAVTKTSSMHCDREEVDLNAYAGDPPDVDPR